MRRRSSVVQPPPTPPLPAPPAAAYLKVRPLSPGDVRTVAAVLERLGPDARHARLGNAQAMRSEREPAALADVDGRRRAAFVARTRDGDPVGIGRYATRAGDPGAADVALAVADDWRGRGVGARLLRMLILQAHGAGLDRLTATAPATNQPALRLLTRHHFRQVAEDGLSVELARPLPRVAG